MASRVLGRSLRRVSADWEAAYGHRLELAETFVDPARFHGGAYDASNWVRVGRTKAFARHDGAYTDPHAVPKEVFVRPLRVDGKPALLPALTSLLVTPSGPTSRPIPFLPPEPSSQSLSQSGSDLQREITLGVSVTPSGRSYRK